MEPPLKRLRLGPSSYGAEDEEDQDELSMTPAQFDTTQDPMYQLDKGRARAATRLKSTFEDIFEKYGRDFDGDDDVINFYTDEIEVDNGHVQSLENRKDGATDGSLSGEEEEEERILNGKSGGQRKKARSKSLVPVNYAGYSQRLQFNSSWNDPQGLGTHPLSSLAFSSPYGTPPPFDFRLSTLGNGHIDPVWQAPDLPAQPTHHQYGSLLGMSGSRSSSFGGLPNLTERRLVKAKSFLRASSTTSKANSADTEEEEDDIILGRSSQAKEHLLSLKDCENVHVPTTSISSSSQSSQSSHQLPPFSGLDPTEDELDAGSDDVGKERATSIITEPTTGNALAPHQSAKEDEDEGTQYHQTARRPHRLSPSHHKRGPPKKSDTRKASNVINKEPTNETRALQPNERRIEIIIPIRKEMSPTIMAQPAEVTALLVGKSPQPWDMERSSNEGIEIAQYPDNPHTSLRLDSDEAAVQQPPTGIAEAPKHAIDPSRFDASPQEQSKHTQEHTGFFSTDNLSDDEEDLEYMYIETGREVEFSRSGLDTFSDDIPDIFPEIGQESNSDNEDGMVSPSQELSSIATISVHEEQATQITNVERGVRGMKAVTHSPKMGSAQSASLAEVSGENTEDDSAEMPDFSLTTTTTEMAVLEMVKSPKPQSSPPKNEDIPRNEPRSLPQSFAGDEVLPMLSGALDSTVALYDTVRLQSVLHTSEVVNSCDNRSPENSVIPKLTESDPCSGRDSLTPSFEASEIGDDEEPSMPHQSICTSMLVAEVDDLRLDSDHQDVQESPSIGVVELPDEDLSVFSSVLDSSSASGSLPLLARPTESDDQHSTTLGRSPSPELGTPVGSKIASRNASRAKISPVPATPTRRQGSRSANNRNSRHRTPSRKRFPLTSLIPEGVDDESDDELSIAGSFSSTSSRLFSPFFRDTHNDNYDLPPLLSTPRNGTRKHSFLTGSPPSSVRKPSGLLGLGHSRNMPPATESRKGRSQTRREPDRAVHSSPLARRVAERLLSSPTKRHHATPARSPSMMPSPNGTLRRCGEDGFECGRDFCLTCCV
ncbi:hypothetical protein F5Y09DRAFT_294770 [Xylaria sp. FL1042]|nr:hypothetical protein F5Y09DRAFT_294770 [Xylaria sp. FL1042]